MLRYTNEKQIYKTCAHFREQISSSIAVILCRFDIDSDSRSNENKSQHYQSYFTTFTCFGAKRVRGKRGRGAGGKTKVFGMKKRGDKVYTQIVNNCSAGELVPIIKKLAPSDSTIYSDEWKAYDGLVNAGYKKHYRVTHSEDVFANGRAHVNGIENFWGVAKNRLVKMRGITCEKFNLHLKETEWRFNHRHENIYKLLLTNLRSYPL